MRAALLCAFVVALPTVAGAQLGTTEITVEEGDTCELLAARLYGEGPGGLEALHQANPELGPLPHHLVAGMVLRAPAPATITYVERSVEQRSPAAESFSAAHTGDPLARGTQVRTDEAASAEIVFRDGAAVTVRERTLVIVYGGRRRLVELALTHAELERGALRSRLGELAADARVEIDTPSSTASLAGAGVVSVEADGTSRIANHASHAASIVADGERIVVPPDMGIVVRRGERPSRPRRLLAAPRWLADQRGFAIGFAGIGASLHGGFSPVPHAAGYRIEVARDAEGEDLVTAISLEADATAFEAVGIVDATVYVSVASIDADGLEGRRSPWRAFSVRLARLVSPGGIDADISASGPPRVLPGTWLVAPRGLTCAVADEPATEIVTLLAVGRRAITCGDASGIGERTRADVEVIAPEVAVEGTLVRDRTASLEFALRGEMIPPAHVLVLRAPDRYTVGRIQESGGRLRVDVTAPVDAPDHVTLTLALSVGTAYVAIADIEVAVESPPIPVVDEPVRTRPAPRAPREEHTVQSAFGDLAWPSMLALRDERRGGLGAWIYGAAIGSDGDPQIRIGGGASAEVPEVPLRFSLATAGDPLGGPQPVDRRGSLDLVTNIGALLHDDALVSVAIDAGAFLPTRGEPDSLGRTRLAPSVELSLRPSSWLALRTRQAALVDLSSVGARLWSSALGADVTPERWLAFGLELDSSVGRFADRDGAALALTAGAELRVSGFEIALGARIALTDEARAFLGPWAGILSLRLFAR